MQTHLRRLLILTKDVRHSPGLATEPVYPFDFAQLAQETRTFLAEVRDAAEGHLDLDDAVSATDGLIGATAALRMALNERAAQELDRAIEVLRRLARSLVPPHPPPPRDASRTRRPRSPR